MKKRLMLSVSILLAGSLLFAQAAENEAAEAAPAAPAVEAPAPKASAPDTSAVVVADRGIDIEADATVTWGIDLGEGTGATAKHGFKNSASWKVKFPIFKKGDITSKSSDSPMYAEVKLKDLEMTVLSTKHKIYMDKTKGKHKPDDVDGGFGINGKVGGIEAKFVFYGAYLTAFDKPSFKTNYADLWEPLKKSDDYDHGPFKFEPGFDGYGFKLGYKNEDIMDLDVGLKFGSNGNWESKDKDLSVKDKLPKYEFKKVGDKRDPDKEAWDVNPVAGLKMATLDAAGITVSTEGFVKVIKLNKKETASHSQYGIGFDLSMKPLDKLLAIAFNVNVSFAKKSDYGFGVAKTLKDDKLAIGFGTKVTSEPMDGLKIKLGFDGGMNYVDPNNIGKEIFAWDMLLDSTYKWVGGGIYVASAGTPYGAADTDMAAYLKFETKGGKKDDGSKEDSYLVNGLDAGAFVGVYKLIHNNAKLPMLFKLWGSYKVAIGDSMWIKPFTTFWAETNHDPLGIAYELGVTFSPVEKVEFTAKWEQGKVEDDRYASTVSEPVIGKNALNKGHNGTFTLACKVKY